MSHQKLLTKLEGFVPVTARITVTSTRMSIAFYTIEISTTLPTTVSNPMMVLKLLAAMEHLFMVSVRSGLMN